MVKPSSLITFTEINHFEINLFHAVGLFLDPLETLENQGFFDVFKVIEVDQWH